MERAATNDSARRADLPPEELRAAPRVTLLIRPAKLATAEGEFVCVIRDVSATGVSVRLFHPLPPGEQAVLETETGTRVAMRRVWVRDHEAGFHFDQPIDVSALVSELGNYRKRRLRIGIELPVTLRVLGKANAAVVHNLSQQGALIHTEVLLARAQMVRLQSEFLPEVRAQVRWRKDNRYGLVFEDTFSLSQFAQIAVQLQRPSLLRR